MKVNRTSQLTLQVILYSDLSPNGIGREGEAVTPFLKTITKCELQVKQKSSLNKLRNKFKMRTWESANVIQVRKSGCCIMHGNYDTSLL